jgi:hypothetical protein
MKNSTYTIGNRTRDLPACSAVPQPTAPRRVPVIISMIYRTAGPGIAQSVQRLAKGWTVRASNPGRGEIFRTRPDRPWGPPSHLYKGQESVELYLYPPLGVRVCYRTPLPLYTITDIMTVSWHSSGGNPHLPMLIYEYDQHIHTYYFLALLFHQVHVFQAFSFLRTLLPIFYRNFSRSRSS